MAHHIAFEELELSLLEQLLVAAISNAESQIRTARAFDWEQALGHFRDQRDVYALMLKKVEAA